MVELTIPNPYKYYTVKVYQGQLNSICPY